MSSPTLGEVDAYTVPTLLVERVARVHAVPLNFADGLLREAKRMLYLCAITNQAVAPSTRVDWAWHEMLMFTSFYKDYATFIGSFIDHVPNPPDADVLPETWEEIQATLGDPRHGSDSYNQTKENYKKYFGITPDPLYWP